MSGARFVHDQLELGGWDVRIADAQKARGLAPLACKTDRIHCWVLAEFARLDPDPGDLAARPGDAGRARARPLPPAPGQAVGCTNSRAFVFERGTETQALSRA